MNVLWSLNLEVGVSYLHGHDRTLAVSRIHLTRLNGQRLQIWRRIDLNPLISRVIPVIFMLVATLPLLVGQLPLRLLQLLPLLIRHVRSRLQLFLYVSPPRRRIPLRCLLCGLQDGLLPQYTAGGAVGFPHGRQRL